MSGLREVIFYLVAACHDDDEPLSGIQFASSDLMGPIGITWDKDSLEKKTLQSLVRGDTSPASNLPKGKSNPSYVEVQGICLKEAYEECADLRLIGQMHWVFSAYLSLVFQFWVY